MKPSTSPDVRDALVRTLPLFEMMRMRAATTARRHPTLGFASDDRGSTLRWINQFTHTHRKLGPHDREVVSPNNDTVYSNAWLDLSQGPVLIHTPDFGQRYWTLGLLDAWTNPWAYVGRRTTGSRRQRTLLHGPNWRGALPAGGVSQVIAAPGDDVWLIGRILVDDTAADLEAVRALQAELHMTRLDGSDAARRIDTALDGRTVAAPPPELFVRTVDAALARNPLPAGETLAWPLDAQAVEQGLPAGVRGAAPAGPAAPARSGLGLAGVGAHALGRRLLTRARVARNLIGALGIDEAMYPTAEADGDGRTLDGGHAYELRFPPGGGPRVGAFWLFWPALDCVVLNPEFARREFGDRAAGHQPLGRDATPIRIGDLVPADRLGFVRAELRLGHACKCAAATRLCTVQVDARHHHVAHLLGLTVPHRHDVHRLLHRIEARGLAVAEHEFDAGRRRAWVETRLQHGNQFVIAQSTGGDFVHVIP